MAFGSSSSVNIDGPRFHFTSARTHRKETSDGTVRFACDGGASVFLKNRIGSALCIRSGNARVPGLPEPHRRCQDRGRAAARDRTAVFGQANFQDLHRLAHEIEPDAGRSWHSKARCSKWKTSGIGPMPSSRPMAHRWHGRSRLASNGTRVRQT